MSSQKNEPPKPPPPKEVSKVVVKYIDPTIYGGGTEICPQLTSLRLALIALSRRAFFGALISKILAVVGVGLAALGAFEPSAPWAMGALFAGVLLFIASLIALSRMAQSKGNADQLDYLLSAVPEEIACDIIHAVGKDLNRSE